MNSTQLLELLNNAYIILLVLAITFFAAAVLLFFLLHILDEIYYLSGYTRKTEMARAEKNYALTGSLLTSDLQNSGGKGQKAKKPRRSAPMVEPPHQPEPEGTAPLQEQTAGKIGAHRKSGVLRGEKGFVLSKNIMVIHTEERIL